MSFLPVFALANFTAAEVAVEPFFVNFIIPCFELNSKTALPFHVQYMRVFENLPLNQFLL